MTRVGQRFEPITANAELYEQMYGRVYQRMYGRLQPLYRALRDIAGADR
jgi:sugar (pentulose or hexulose) kinase